MGGGLKKKDFLHITKEQILTLYKAGPDAVLSFIFHILDLFYSLRAQIETQQEVIDNQKWQIEGQEKRIQELEVFINKNNHNSHKPPSSDGLKKIAKVRKPSGKKPGGQKGHKGTTLRMVGNPDIIDVHKVEHCGHCGEPLKGKEVLGYDRRQAFDLPPIKVEVTEHQAEIKECGRCGTLITAEFPEEVRHKIQYGPGLKATATYIKGYGLLFYERAVELFEGLFGVPPECQDLGENRAGDWGTLGGDQRTDQGLDSGLADRTF